MRVSKNWLMQSQRSDEKVTIDVRYPRKYMKMQLKLLICWLEMKVF